MNLIINKPYTFENTMLREKISFSGYQVNNHTIQEDTFTKSVPADSDKSMENDLSDPENLHKFIKDIEKLTKIKATKINPSLKYFCTTTVLDSENKPKTVYAFIKKTIKPNKKDESIYIALFDERKYEIGYIYGNLNVSKQDSREVYDRNDPRIYNKGEGINPYLLEDNPDFVYVTWVDNFFNSRNLNTENTCSHYKKKKYDDKTIYKGAATRLYQILAGYIEQEKLDSIQGIACHAKINNGSRDAHRKLGFSEYEKIIYTEDNYTGKETEYQGMYLEKAAFDKLKQEGSEIIKKSDIF